jgi:cobalt/nickel transport system permease protein
MHLGNGAITPECAALTMGAAGAGLAVSAAALRRSGVTAETLQRAATLGCAVFAAQAFNVPLVAGFSGHFVGGVLLAWFLGPALAAWTMAAVLAVQALALGDGGIAALGANILNMALVPAAIGGLVSRGRLSATVPPIAIAIASAVAVVLGAGLVVAETAAFRSSSELTSWSPFATSMAVNHAWIGLLEGVATAAAVTAAQTSALPVRLGKRLTLGLAAAAILAALAFPISSTLPDGYEAAAQASGLAWLLR